MIKKEPALKTKISGNWKSKNKAKSYHTSIPKPLILKYDCEEEGASCYWDTKGDFIILQLVKKGNEPKPLPKLLDLQEVEGETQQEN